MLIDYPIGTLHIIPVVAHIRIGTALQSKQLARLGLISPSTDQS